MPPDMEIDMRHTKLTREDAALLTGELKKPSWQSKNEGIHEKVSFEDSIWGFDLAGGSYYKTPLRVVSVKPDSRADKAGIRPGDRLKRINDIDTSTLSIQEAHEIIIESGIHLKIAVTAPEDEEDSYYCYEDPLQEGYDSDEERRLQEEKVKKREVHAKVSSYWSLKWPWVSKRRVIYRESNCFMVPSKYEDKHRDLFTPQPMLRIEDDIVLQSAHNEYITNSNKNNESGQTTSAINGVTAEDSKIETKNDILSNNVKIQETNHFETNGDVEELESHETKVNVHNELSEVEDESVAEESIVTDLRSEEILSEEVATEEFDTEELLTEELKSEIEETTVSEAVEDNDVIKEVLNETDSISKAEEDNIIDSILSDSEGPGNSVDER